MENIILYLRETFERHIAEIELNLGVPYDA